MPAIDPDNPRQPYEQIADYLRNEIKAGRLSAGDRVPSGRELASLFTVAHGTAARAISELRTEGLIVSWQGRGAFVRDTLSTEINPETIDPGAAYSAIMNRLDEVHAEVQELSARVDKLEKGRKAR